MRNVSWLVVGLQAPVQLAVTQQASTILRNKGAVLNPASVQAALPSVSVSLVCLRSVVYCVR